jgi:hypothetical protein
METTHTSPELFACPCCGSHTLAERHAWEICSICRWEDEPEDRPEMQELGPNHMTLAAAREEFARTGSIDG